MGARDVRPYIEGVNVTIRTDHAPLEYIKSKTNKCKRLERWALRLQEFRFTIQPRPAAQQKHVDALSRAPVPVEKGQQPIELDVFPERVVLRVAAWEAQPVSAALGNFTRDGAFPGAALYDVAVRAVKQRRAPTRRSPRLNKPQDVCAEDSESDMCEVLLSEGDSSEDEQDRGETSALEDASASREPEEVRPLESAVAERSDDSGAREYEDCPTPPPRSIALPPPVQHLDLVKAQAADEECALFRSLASLPRSDWPRSWANAPLRFVLEFDVLCVVFQERPSPQASLKFRWC